MLIPGLPLVTNTTLTNVNTEVVITLPANCKKFTLQARQNADLKFSYTESASGTIYFTIKAGNSYFEDNIRTNNKIYIQSPSAGTIVEMVVWSGGDDIL